MSGPPVAGFLGRRSEAGTDPGLHLGDVTPETPFCGRGGMGHHVIYPLAGSGISWVLSSLRDCEWNCYKHPWADFRVDMFPTPVDKYQGARLPDHMVRVHLISRDCQAVFRSGCTLLHSQQQRTRVPVVHVLGSPWRGQFSRFLPFYLVEREVFHCCFNLRVPDDIWLGSTIHKLIWHVCIFSREVSVEIFDLFFNQVFFFS